MAVYRPPCLLSASNLWRCILCMIYDTKIILSFPLYILNLISIFLSLFLKRKTCKKSRIMGALSNYQLHRLCHDFKGSSPPCNIEISGLLCVYHWQMEGKCGLFMYAHECGVKCSYHCEICSDLILLFCCLFELRVYIILKGNFTTTHFYPPRFCRVSSSFLQCPTLKLLWTKSQICMLLYTQLRPWYVPQGVESHTQALTRHM